MMHTIYYFNEKLSKLAGTEIIGTTTIETSAKAWFFFSQQNTLKQKIDSIHAKIFVNAWNWANYFLGVLFLQLTCIVRSHRMWATLVWIIWEVDNCRSKCKYAYVRNNLNAIWNCLFANLVYFLTFTQPVVNLISNLS